MIEECIWFFVWIVLLCIVHYQFKVCIPVTLFCLKVIESLVLLLLLKVFVFFQVYGNNIDLKNVTSTLYNVARDHMSKIELWSHRE